MLVKQMADRVLISCESEEGFTAVIQVSDTGNTTQSLFLIRNEKEALKRVLELEGIEEADETQ